MQRSNKSRSQRDGGYFLLAVMLMMAFIVIAAAYVVGPRIVQQLKRDREEEMIHRGTEYARAIKKFYKKNGRYPASLDDLDKGQIRFLRKRYKDPLTKDGKWKMLQYGDIQSLLNTAGPGTPVSGLNQAGPFTPGGGAPGLSPSPTNSSYGGFGSQALIQQQQAQLQAQQQNPGLVVGSPAGSGDTGGATNPGGTTGNSGFSLSLGGSQNPGDQSGASGGANGTNGSSAFGQNSGSTQAFGGVASLSKDPTIRIYNKKKKYDEWQFIYNPVMDQANVLLRGPYQPSSIGNTNIGTPASQLGQQNGQNQQQNGFGQPNNGLGQQPTLGQQPGKYPPDQNQQ